MMAAHQELARCSCGALLAACPACREAVCCECEDWQRFHSVRGWLERCWARVLTRMARGVKRRGDPA